MIENINYDSLLILCLFAFITPIIINLFKKFKIPFVVGEIFVGIIIGNSFLNLVHEDIWIIFLSDLGLAFLMFLSGLEINIDRVEIGKNKKKAYHRIFISILMFAISLGISFALSYLLFKLGIIKNVLFMSFIFAAAAPGLIVPLMKERNLINTEYGQTLLIFSIISEFICLISMTIISSTISHGLNYKSFLFVLIFLSAFLIYIALKKAHQTFNFSTDFFNTLHLGVRAAFAIILILVTISNKVGSEIALGSFLAGIIFTIILGKDKEELKYELDIIGYGFLIPIYFIMVGVNLNLKSIFNNPKSLLLIPLFLSIFFIVKLIPCFLLKFKYNTNKSISAAFMLSGQLSVIIVGSAIAYNLNIISTANYSAIILTTVISCILFPMLFDKFFKYDNIQLVNTSHINKISVMEIVPSNKIIFNKPLKDLCFPHSFRIFIIIRDENELLHDGDTVIKKGDVLVIAALNDKIDEVKSILI